MDRIPITIRGHKRVEEEIKKLKHEDRPAIIEQIATAREHGDLKENAEYHAAKDRQSFIEGRIQELEHVIANSEVIDPTTLSGTIKFGATVTVYDNNTEKEHTYQIVGDIEADLEKGLISLHSPIARALIGKDEGDMAQFTTPSGKKSYEVVKVEFK